MSCALNSHNSLSGPLQALRGWTMLWQSSNETCGRNPSLSPLHKLQLMQHTSHDGCIMSVIWWPSHRHYTHWRSRPNGKALSPNTWILNGRIRLVQGYHTDQNHSERYMYEEGKSGFRLILAEKKWNAFGQSSRASYCSALEEYWKTNRAKTEVRARVPYLLLFCFALCVVSLPEWRKRTAQCWDAPNLDETAPNIYCDQKRSEAKAFPQHRSSQSKFGFYKAGCFKRT